MPEPVTFRRPAINGLVLGSTILVIILSQLSYSWLASVQYGLLVIGTLVIGIPHGATDDYIFQQTGLQHSLLRSLTGFYGIYVLIAGFYAALWYVIPTASLAFFLLISIYHFGQSQLFYLKSQRFLSFKLPLYLLWGSYVLLLPLMFSYTEALPIIRELIGYKPLTLSRVSGLAVPAAAALFLANLGLLGYARVQQLLTDQQLIQEIGNLVVLGLLAYTTPLFVAFITYWALWHSFNSMIEITTFLTRQAHTLAVGGFYQRALPLSLITFAGIGVVFWLTRSYGSRESMLAIFFIIIAAVTVPHTILMDVLYRQKLGTP